MTLQRFQNGLLVAAFLLIDSPARLVAGGITGNYIVGQWSNPVLDGCLVDAVDRASFLCENTVSTGVYSFSNAALSGGPLAKSTLSEGANPTPSPGIPAADLVTFIGGTIPATHDTVPFGIGGISFTNGTSIDGSQIYGATLNLFASNGSTSQFIGSEFIQFNATLNSGTDAQNADYLTFTGLAGISFDVYEGATATGQLLGLVVGDPQAQLTNFALDPGQSGISYVGADPALPSSIPEPSSLSLLAGGALGLSAAVARRRMASIK